MTAVPGKKAKRVPAPSRPQCGLCVCCNFVHTSHILSCSTCNLSTHMQRVSILACHLHFPVGASSSASAVHSWPSLLAQDDAVHFSHVCRQIPCKCIAADWHCSSYSLVLTHPRTGFAHKLLVSAFLLSCPVQNPSCVRALPMLQATSKLSHRELNCA